MVNSRRISFAAAVLILLITILPLLSLNADASIYDVYNDAVTRSGVYKVSLMDADFFNSENGCLTKSQETQLLDLMQ